MTPLVALRTILDVRRLVSPVGDTLTLTETAAASRCPPLHIRANCEQWAVRLNDGDCLHLLAELPKAESVRRLPDYLLFSAPDTPPKYKTGPVLRVLVCELKSSATGAESALPQIQLGKAFADYLLKLAAHRLGTATPPVADYSGLIVSPSIPASLISKGRTRPGPVAPHSDFDTLSDMPIYKSPADVPLWLKAFY